MNEREITQIGLSYPENLPQGIVSDILTDIPVLDDRFKVQKLPPEAYIYNCFEWAVPGLIVAYVLKPYFDSFLGEAGKDHYNLLSTWLKKLVVKARSLKVKTVAAT